MQKNVIMKRYIKIKQNNSHGICHMPFWSHIHKQNSPEALFISLFTFISNLHIYNNN